MEDYAVSFWIYIAVMSIFVCGAVKKFLASHIGAMPSVVAWLCATLLVERLCALCMPAVLARLVLCVSCWLYFTWATPKPSLPVEGKAVFITGKKNEKNRDETGKHISFRLIAELLLLLNVSFVLHIIADSWIIMARALTICDAYRND